MVSDVTPVAVCAVSPTDAPDPADVTATGAVGPGTVWSVCRGPGGVPTEVAGVAAEAGTTTCEPPVAEPDEPPAAPVVSPDVLPVLAPLVAPVSDVPDGDTAAFFGEGSVPATTAHTTSPAAARTPAPISVAARRLA
jgi:hypothetical protein